MEITRPVKLRFINSNQLSSAFDGSDRGHDHIFCYDRGLAKQMLDDLNTSSNTIRIR